MSDPTTCNGQPVIKGTRVTLRAVLASLAEGATVQELLDDFPSLSEQDLRAVISFAAASTLENSTPRANSTHPADEEWDTVWLKELDRRMEARRLHEETGAGWSEVRARILKEQE